MEVWDLLQKQKEGKLSYKDGVTLFFTLWPEKKKSLASFFTKEDVYSRRKLKKELGAKFDELQAIQQQNNFVDFSISKNRNNPIDLSKLPTALRKEHARLGPIIREIASLHARLYNCSTDSQRYEYAWHIVELVAERRAIFTKIDEFNATGRVTEQLQHQNIRAVPNIEKDYKVEYELKLLRSQRTKLKKNPRRVHELNEVIKKIFELEKNRYA